VGERPRPPILPPADDRVSTPSMGRSASGPADTGSGDARPALDASVLRRRVPFDRVALCNSLIVDLGGRVEEEVPIQFFHR